MISINIRYHEQHSSTDLEVFQPSRSRLLGHFLDFQGLTVHNSVDGLPYIKELAIVQVFCRAFIRLADRHEFRRQHPKQGPCYKYSPRPYKERTRAICHLTDLSGRTVLTKEIAQNYICLFECSVIR